MRLDKLTIKAQEALEAASGIASENDAAQIEPEHLLTALLDQADGIVRPMLAKVGADADALSSTVAGYVAGLPRVRGGAGRRRSEATHPA